MSNIQKGKYGEDLACEFLTKKGYRIIDRNYKYSRYGEVDIIALIGGDLCFVEVKTRTQNRFGSPFEAITKEKLFKILQCAKNYASKSPVKFKKIRLDAISVEIKDENVTIKHIENLEF